MANPGRNEKTSDRVASIASKLLSDPKSSKDVKTIAASVLTQAPNKATRPSSSKPYRPTGNKK